MADKTIEVPAHTRGTATMRMVMTTLLFCAGALVSPAASFEDQSATPHPRLAAVRFAIENGWQFPKDVVLAAETFVRMPDGPRPIPRSPEEDATENQQIATLLGGVKIGRTRDYLSCPSDFLGPSCLTTTNDYFLVVGRPFVGQSGVILSLYTPPGRNNGREAVTQASVKLERRGAEWTAIHYGVQPRTLSRVRKD
jgi:hypothetical protein